VENCSYDNYMFAPLSLVLIRKLDGVSKLMTDEFVMYMMEGRISLKV
jgi:hypothetical protein